MTHTGSCITVALMAIHLFGLSDGHGFTTQQRTRTRTRTDTHVSEHIGRCVGCSHSPPGDGHGEGWGPHASSGGGCDGTGPVAGDKAVNITREGWCERAERGALLPTAQSVQTP